MALTKQDFLAQIRTKYTAYDNIDDDTLYNKIIEKYPVYKDQIQEETTLGGVKGGLVGALGRTGVGEKTKASFKEGIGRIKEAGEGAVGVGGAEPEFSTSQSLIRGAAGAVQAVASPITGLLGEGIETIIEKIPDDIKKTISEKVAPTVEGVTSWYEGQSDEQRERLDDIGVGVEVLLNFVGAGAVSKGLKPAKAIVGKGLAKAEDITKPILVKGQQITQGLKTSTKKVSKTGDKGLLKKLDIETEKGKIGQEVVNIPKTKEGVVTKLSTPFREKNVKVLAGRALSPRTVGKSAKQKLKSITDVEKNTKQFYDNIRTGKIKGDINTIEDSAQTVVNNIDTVGAKIGKAVEKLDGNIDFDADIMKQVSTAIDAKGAGVTPATNILKQFKDELGDGTLSIADSYKLKKAYGNEISKLYKAGDSGTIQYKALSDGVKFLNTKIDDLIDSKLGTQYAKDKTIFRNLKLIVDDLVASSLVEGRRAPNSLAEQIGMIQGIFSPISTTKHLFIKEIGELNTRGGAWRELIKLYDKGAKSSLVTKSKKIGLKRK